MKNYNSIQLLQNITNDIMPVLVYPILNKHTKDILKKYSVEYHIDFARAMPIKSGLVPFNQDELGF